MSEKKTLVAGLCVLITSSPFHSRCMYQISVQTGRTHTWDRQNGWNARTWDGKHLPVVRGMALRTGKCIKGDAQGLGSLGHGIYLGTLWWDHWGMDHFRLVTVPCPGSVLLRRHLTRMEEVEMAALDRSWACSNVSLSKSLCQPEILLHYSALRNIFHLKTDTSLKPV